MALDAMLAGPDREIVQARSGWTMGCAARARTTLQLLFLMRACLTLMGSGRRAHEGGSTHLANSCCFCHGLRSRRIADREQLCRRRNRLRLQTDKTRLLRAKIDISSIFIERLRNTPLTSRKSVTPGEFAHSEGKDPLPSSGDDIARSINHCIAVFADCALHGKQRPGLRRLRFTNDSIRRLSGFSSSDFLRQPNLWEARLNPEEHGRVIQAFANIEKAGSATVEYRWRCADGTEKHVLDHAVLSEFKDGRRELFGFWLDVSDRKSLETDLLHASKLEAVGRLTGGIVHDLRKHAEGVIGNLECFICHSRQTRRCRRLHSALEGERMRRTDQRLLAFVRRTPDRDRFSCHRNR